MLISEAAKAAGMPVKTVRYYEDIGLISAAGRSDNGYRIYGRNELHLLRFVKRARDLGFSVRDCSNLVALYQDKSRASGDVKELARNHIASIDRKIAELEEMRATLGSLVDKCQGDDRPDCPILADLGAALDGGE